MKVLVVVEDDADMARLIEIVFGTDTRLELTGHASTAAEAIDAARSIQPDVVVLDHYISGEVMGLAAAPMLKAAAPDCKIILFTEHDLHAEAAREPAVDAYLPKARISELLSVVHQLLGMAN